MVSVWVRRLEQGTPLPHDDRCRLDELVAAPVPFEADRDVVVEGRVSPDAVVVLQGWACRYKLLSDGRRQITAFLLPGDMCDLHVFLEQPMDHSIGTLTPARVALVPRDRLLGLARERWPVMQALWWSTLRGEAILREWLAVVGRRSAAERIAHLLYELLLRLQAVGLTEDHAYVLPLTQAEIADTLGLTPVHVNRTLQTLRQDGLIELDSFGNRRLTILDPEGLAALADFDARYLRSSDRNGAKLPDRRRTAD